MFAQQQAVASEALTLTPLPPLIEYGSVANFFGDRFMNRYLSAPEDDKAMRAVAAHATASDASLPAGNDDGARLIGKPLPVQRFVCGWRRSSISASQTDQRC